MVESRSRVAIWGIDNMLERTITVLGKQFAQLATNALNGDSAPLVDKNYVDSIPSRCIHRGPIEVMGRGKMLKGLSFKLCVLLHLPQTHN